MSLHFVAREGRAASLAPLPPYPAPEQREDLFLILGKQYPWTSPERATTPTWLTIPERGLYTGLLVLSAIGSGKTSACLYPYVEQLLAYPAGDSTRRAAGLAPQRSRRSRFPTCSCANQARLASSTHSAGLQRLA